MPARARAFGRYDLLAHLATGGMAEIYLARMRGAEGFEKLVVVKLLLEQLAQDAEYVEMFLDEARINSHLSHSNVVQCLELGEVDGRYFMAMEYVSGLSVAQVGRLATQRLGQVPQFVAAGVIAQAAAGLHNAHERKAGDGTPLGIIHRDISPQNLIVTREGIVKLVDFGIAKAAGRSTKTRAGILKGKYAYMSPEQCLGAPIDRRSDIFSLGIVLFELATSRRLFKRDTTYGTCEAIARSEAPDAREVNPGVSPEVAAVIRKALAHDLAQRYQTADDLQEALEVAMQRTGLRGTTTALGQFLEETFAPELQKQGELVAQAETGSLPRVRPARGVEDVSVVPGTLTEGDPDDEPTEHREQDSLGSEDAAATIAGPPPIPIAAGSAVEPIPPAARSFGDDDSASTAIETVEEVEGFQVEEGSVPALPPAPAPPAASSPAPPAASSPAPGPISAVAAVDTVPIPLVAAEGPPSAAAPAATAQPGFGPRLSEVSDQEHTVESEPSGPQPAVPPWLTHEAPSPPLPGSMRPTERNTTIRAPDTTQETPRPRVRPPTWLPYAALGACAFGLIMLLLALLVLP